MAACRLFDRRKLGQSQWNSAMPFICKSNPIRFFVRHRHASVLQNKGSHTCPARTLLSTVVSNNLCSHYIYMDTWNKTGQCATVSAFQCSRWWSTSLCVPYFISESFLTCCSFSRAIICCFSIPFTNTRVSVCVWVRWEPGERKARVVPHSQKVSLYYKKSHWKGPVLLFSSDFIIKKLS